MGLTMKGTCLGLVVAGSLFLMSGTMLAQEGPGGGGQPPSPPSASEIVSKMKQDLGLTDEQVSQVTSIIQDESSQMEALMKSGDPQSGRSQMEAIQQQTESKLAQVLTADQLAKWKSSKPQGPQGNSGSGASE
jgi:hypothetical protein